MAATKPTRPAEEKPAGAEPGSSPETIGAISIRLDNLTLSVTELNQHLEKRNLLEHALVPDPDSERIKPLRRRSQDEMEAALRRLLSPEMRPQDDDSPQVVQDAFAEVIALRQLTHDLMQTLTSGYQHGLAVIRDMTNR